MQKEQRKQFLRDNFKLKTLCFKWSNSGVCRIYNFRDEKTNFSAGGYGYDKKGSCLGQLINHYFEDDLKKLKSDIGGQSFRPVYVGSGQVFRKRDGLYGVRHWNKSTGKAQKTAAKHTITSADGACGFDSMRAILEKIGFILEHTYESNSISMYTLRSK